MPWRAARPERGSTRPAWPSGIATAIPVPTLARSPGPIVAASAARRSQPASWSCARSGAARLACRRWNSTINVRAGRRSARKGRRRSATAAGTRALTRTPWPCPRARGRPPARAARDSTRPALVGHQQLHASRPARNVLLDPPAQLLAAPRPSSAETSTASRWRARDHAALVGVQLVDLVQDQQASACRPRRSPPARRRQPGSSRSSSSSPTDASTTCRIRSALTVSSRVALNASTSWCGSLRMKPTVSVTRYARPS